MLKLNKKFNFPVSILRLYLVYGPKQDENRVVPITIKNAIKDNNFDCSSGSQYRDFLYVDDLLEALFKTLKNKNSSGEIFNIGSGKPIKVKNLILKICKIIGHGKPEFGVIKLRKDEIKNFIPAS